MRVLDGVVSVYKEYLQEVESMRAHHPCLDV
jgi:hypothetical protein